MAEKDVAARLKEKNRDILWKPVSDKFGVGTPDRVGKFKGAAGEVFWAELKYLKELPKNSCKVGLKPKQASWLQEWQDAGGHSFLLIGIESCKKVAIFCKDFRRISHEGISREEYDLVDYEDVGKNILRIVRNG